MRPCVFYKMVESTSSLPKNTKLRSGRDTGSTMSGSNSNLMSRRRRHKTVHFGDNLLSEVRRDELTSPSGECESRGSVVSLPGQFEQNVHQLFTFIGTVLSAWDKDDSSKTERAKPSSSSSSYNRRKHHPNALDYLLNGDGALNADDNLGSPIFKHKHCKLPAGSCNALFLRKVSHIVNRIKLQKLLI